MNIRSILPIAALCLFGACQASAQEYRNTVSLTAGNFITPLALSYNPIAFRRPVSVVGVRLAHQIKNSRFGVELRADRWTPSPVLRTLREKVPAGSDAGTSYIESRSNYSFVDLAASYSQILLRKNNHTIRTVYSAGPSIGFGDDTRSVYVGPDQPNFCYTGLSETQRAVHPAAAVGAAVYYSIPSTHLEIGLDERVRMMAGSDAGPQCYSTFQIGYGFSRCKPKPAAQPAK